MFIKTFWYKNHKKLIPVVALIALVVAGHFVFSKPKIEKTKTPSKTENQTIAQQTKNNQDTSTQTEQDTLLKEQIGQMLILGFRGTTFQEKSFIDKSIKNLKIGGVILFDYDSPLGVYPRNIINANQVKKLTTDLQKNSATPLFVSIDVEGGLVNRLKPKYGFIEIPSASQMGQGSPENTFNIALNLGKQLKSLGINFDFAPVVDLNINPQNPVIGKLGRAFSANPQIVISHAENFIKGLTENNIISSIKHFPGHGSSKTDSHQGITDITNTYQAQELIPFQELVKKNIVPSIMVAHTFNKNLDEKYPASMSSNTIQKTLKDLVGFKGVVVCDDLSMGAISQNYGLEEASVKMVQAGCDIIIISNNVKTYDETLPQKVFDAIFKAVKSQQIATSSVETSYQKILQLKEDFYIMK